jgi:outer membrane protein insertion porin family
MVVMAALFFSFFTVYPAPLFADSGDPAYNLPALTGPEIKNISVEGNSEVVASHILSVVTSRIGEPVDEEKLRKDAEAIYEQGFFAATDYKVTDTEGGVNVAFVVQENPIVSAITFTGNTVYSSEVLADLIFTRPGMIFNRNFFRNDLQRIKEKYQGDGYVMTSVADVQIEGDTLNVVIVEPRVEKIIIQGNRITKTKVIQRYIRLKEGDIFNSNKLRLSLSRLQGLGFFSDVNVNFEPGEENPNDVVLILTVDEARTGRLGLNVAYGTESGFGGGANYENTNIAGRGLKLNVGFDLGKRKEYWLSLEQPFMSGKVMSWRFGAYRQSWDDLRYYRGGVNQFEYDRDKTGAYFGFGKKFRDESLYNWYVLLDWHKVENDVSASVKRKFIWTGGINPVTGQYIVGAKDDLGEGDSYSATLSLRRYNVDEYLPYIKGDVESINFQIGRADIDSEIYNYYKYWLETKLYIPVGKMLQDFFETSFGVHEDKPITFAARLRIGASAGDVPYEEMYAIGGDNTLRGYQDDRFHGEKMLLGNFELRIPIDKAVSIVLFYDIGRAWRDDENVSFGSDLGKAPGLGVRLNTPIGNVRLDYAKGEDDDRFHFGFGEMF